MQPNEVERLLPAIFQRTRGDGTPLAALLDVMAALLQPAEDVLDGLDRNFSARRAPDDFVSLLARWVDLDVPITTGLGHRREAIARAVELSQWRGSPHGLQASLETATGRTGFVFDEHVQGAEGQTRPFHVGITVPKGLTAHEAMIRQIVEREKPAHVTFELHFAEDSGKPEKPATPEKPEKPEKPDPPAKPDGSTS